MLASALSALLLSASFVSTAPVPILRRQTRLDAAATAEAQQRDNTATRAFTAVPIVTADGRCLQVVSGTGDFRENLLPITAATCNGSPGQQWDVITRGLHNNRAGQALIVSTLINGCMNFDPRRAAGNQVILFSCGGRADGGGQVTDSQLFAFTGGNGPLALVPANGQGRVILAANGNALDQSAGSAATARGNQLFTIGQGGANAPAPAPPAPPAPVVTPPPANAPAPAPPTGTGPQAVSRAGGVLNPTAAAEAMKRDNTATRALSNTQIKSADGNCLTVNPFAGDFRQNLIPVESKPCDGSAGQTWDVITAGIHNDQPGNALIVSALTQGCLNFDERRAAGDQVILFSCGGRADGDGRVTDSQLFPFTSAANPIAISPKNSRDSRLLVVVNGKLDNVAGSARTAQASQLFAFGNGAAAPAPAPAPAPQEPAPAPAPPATTTPAPAPAPAPTAATPTGPQPVSRAGGVLNPTAAAEAMRRDDTATRALSGAQIKSADGNCLSVDPFAGDFRQNLIPVESKPCDGSAGQKWDVITAGVHNDQPGNALLVSALTQGCLNFDERRAAGDQVILFSCGGRADGDGRVTDSQLFPFTSAAQPIALSPKNSRNSRILAVVNGKLDTVAGSVAAAGANQKFTIAV